MRKILITCAIIAGSFGVAYAANVFPTSLNSWTSGNTITSSWANSLETKIGIDNSADITSLDYKVRQLVGTTTLGNLSLPFTQVTGTSSPVNSYIHSSTTIVKSYSNNTFTGENYLASTTFTAIPRSTVDCAADGQLCDFTYVNAIAAAGVASATPTVAGKMRVSYAPVDANEPIAVGDNDPRIANYVKSVSTTTTSKMATTTLYGIPFGSKLDLIVEIASTTPGINLAMWFNDNNEPYNTKQIYANQLTSNGGAVTSNDSLKTIFFSPSSFSGASGIQMHMHFTIYNSTTTPKLGNGLIYSATSTGTTIQSGDISTMGFVWATTTASINSVSIAPTSLANGNGIGAGTVIKAYVTQ